MSIAPLVFGGNVFGWTADQAMSFRLLDAFVDAGLNAIDTADAYSTWVPGHVGGESEAVIGAWLKANPDKRDKVVICTKVGSPMGEGKKGLSERWILQAVEDSLRRLQVDVIDLYQSHWPDPETSHEVTLAAYDKLLKAGKVRAIGTSNLDAAELHASLDAAKKHGLPRYETLQPHYNLYERAGFEGPLADLCIREGLDVICYFALASGFLTGKYRSKADLKKSVRGERLGKYLDGRGLKTLAALDAVAARTGATQAAVALAWLIGRPGVTAPIASATSPAQMESLIAATRLRLSAEDRAELDKASAT
jgi:aryl-alcohol dehydrogenase-like predicted oxidoreductase